MFFFQENSALQKYQQQWKKKIEKNKEVKKAR